jgi:hypothetical protein
MIGAAASGAMLALPTRALAGSEIQNQVEKVLRSVSELSPSQQLKWWEKEMGPEGRLWHFVREGDFSDAALQHLFTILGSTSRALNDQSVRDSEMKEYRDRIPDLSEIPHMYTLAADMSDGTTQDIGNVQVVHHKGKLLLQSSRHVVDVLRKTHPELRAAFYAPSRKNPNDPEPDIAFARLARAPVVSDADRRVIDIPADFSARDSYGQVNVVYGFKSDGGPIRHAGLVLPTPPKMLQRLHTYWQASPVRSMDEMHVLGQMQQGGLMLMPDFFGELDEKERPRGLGRSGSLRLVYSRKHQTFVPGSNFMAIMSGRQEAGLSLGFVDSVTHSVRALTELDAQARSGAPARSLLPRAVPDRPGYFRIDRGVYLRRTQ